MHYPPHIPEEQRFAVGHEAFGLVPGLMMYATIWLREHNRVCHIMKQEHPDWDDERIFQTTRLILIGESWKSSETFLIFITLWRNSIFPLFLFPGETIKIVIEDYVQHLSGYNFKLKFDPELLFNERFQYQNRISSEFNTLYHWHPLMPDTFQIQDQVYGYHQFVFNNSILTKHGIHNMVDSFTKQTSGRVSFSIDRKLLREASCRSKRLSFFCGRYFVKRLIKWKLLGSSVVLDHSSTKYILCSTVIQFWNDMRVSKCLFLGEQPLSLYSAGFANVYNFCVSRLLVDVTCLLQFKEWLLKFWSIPERCATSL